MSSETQDEKPKRKTRIPIDPTKFGYGAIAGACGASAVYPIDLVKTRLQNQRTKLYKNSAHCFAKVIRNEGPLGLYRGLLPQLTGVMPEKAVLLFVNDLVRAKLTTSDGQISARCEIVAGAVGGTFQSLISNPLEIVKVRLQTAGEVATKQKINALVVIRELGVTNLYRGIRACWMRDISYAAIFFPLYANAKLLTADEKGVNNMPSLLLSALISASPAAFLATPADVIKTRLQVAARPGQTVYNGVIDCARTMMREEGFGAFWKGAIPRVCRSSPQFAVTLFSYEMLQKFFSTK
ncbi:mitochondrial carrier protein [Ditylenchus destructor]|nr:mitochondrial carrier protein [Ditylenchus destructor]